MLAEDRMARICEIVTARGAATLTELCSALDASESTIRRDLVRLDADGRVERVHGGARAKSDSNLVSTDQSVAEKHDINAAQKRAIAKVAAGLVGPGDLVYIDSGTTCELMADYLAETRATYVTNSLPLAQRLLARGMQVILPGGRVKPLTEALVGEEAIDALSRVSSALCARSATDTASSFMRAVLAASIVMRPAPSVRTVIKSSYAAPDCSDSRTASFIVSTAMA